MFKRLTVRCYHITKEQDKKVKKLADKLVMSKSSFIRKLINEYKNE
jgi:hypothetical protein